MAEWEQFPPATQIEDDDLTALTSDVQARQKPRVIVRHQGRKRLATHAGRDWDFFLFP